MAAVPVRPSVLTTRQAAQALGEPARTVRRWVAVGKLRGIKVGDRLLVDGASVSAMAAQRCGRTLGSRT
jgi:excisionase family DNA binding protein